MKTAAQSARRWLVVALLGSVAAMTAACSSTGTSATSTKTIIASASPESPVVPVSASPTSPAAPAGPGECSTAALRVSIGQSQGTAGTIYFNIDFTNASNTTCVLQGYPGVSLVSAGSDAGSQIGSDAKRNPLRPTKPITIAPGQTANALLGVSDAGAFSASTCRPTTAHWLKVFPPDQFVATYVRFTTQTCASTLVHTMHIATIAAGA